MASNKKTPLLQKLRSNSGTVYVFPSASEDIGLNLNSEINGVSITHYALINIPNLDPVNWLYGVETEDEFSQPQNMPYIASLSLQNYAMNMETTLLNKDNYNFQALSTVSERCFWHWMMTNKSMRPETLRRIEVNGQEYFYEPDRVNNIVKCFGAVDAGNSLSAEFGIFNETYINVPSSYGGGPVFFKSRYDQNLQPNFYPVTSTTALEGRTSGITYTTYSWGKDYPYTDKVTGDDGKTFNYGYALNGSVTNGIDALEIETDIAKIRECLKVICDDNIDEIWSYDDMNIDLRGQLKSNEKSLVSKEFEFNAILLYYTVYDKNDAVLRGSTVNLFGIIFLDGVSARHTDTYRNGEIVKIENLPTIPGITKRKSTDTDFGTAYSFRVNVKTLSIYDNSDAVIQDNTTLSSIYAADFSGAVSQLNRAIDIMNANTDAVRQIQDSYVSVIQYYDEQAGTVKNLKTTIDNIMNGKMQAAYTLDGLYCNNFYNVVDASNPSTGDCIKFYLASKSYDSAGKLRYQYNEDGTINYFNDDNPYVLMLDSSGLHSHTISTGTSYHQKEYRVLAKGVRDCPILMETEAIDSLDHSYDVNVRHEIANEMLEKMFDSSDNLTVKLYNDPRNYVGYLSDEVAAPIQNWLYIDEASPVFDASSNNETICCLKDKNTGFIDYPGLIPYIVAQLQKTSFKFNYQYSLSNSIYGIDDIHTIKDALDFVLNVFHYDDMENYIAQLTPVIYEAVYDPVTKTYKKGNKIEQYTLAGIPYFYRGQSVFVEFEFLTAEPNNNMLGEVNLNNTGTNLLSYVTSTPSMDQIVYKSVPDEYGMIWQLYNNVICTKNSEISNRIEVDEYTGTYFVELPTTSIHTEITLRSTVHSETMRQLMDKTISSDVKCIVKCYYWAGLNETKGFTSSVGEDIDLVISVPKGNDTELKTFTIQQLMNGYAELHENLKYFDFEDKITRLSETRLNVDFVPIMDADGQIKDFEDMYIYFMLPYYDDVVYNNVHVYADIDVGVGGYEKFNNGQPVGITINGITSNYVIYRTCQRQNSYVNIKLG